MPDPKTPAQITETERGLLRFPGSVPGALRRGSPVIKTWNAPCIPDDDPNDEFTLHGIYLRDRDEGEAGRRCYCWFDSEQIGLDVGFPPDIDLTDATGRAHLAWWVAEKETRVPCVAMWDGTPDGPVGERIGVWRLRYRSRSWPGTPSCTGCGVYTSRLEKYLSTLDPDDPRLLPDGSRLVDALALSLVAQHVAGLDREPSC